MFDFILWNVYLQSEQPDAMWLICAMVRVIVHVVVQLF